MEDLRPEEICHKRALLASHLLVLPHSGHVERKRYMLSNSGQPRYTACGSVLPVQASRKEMNDEKTGENLAKTE